MNDRFKFRATFPVSYYDENGNDKDIKLTIYDVAVYSGGEIGFSAQQIETVIDALKLPEVEEDTMWQFINDNYGTSCYEWFICDNAIIEQCTGLKDKNGNLIYEGDIVRFEIVDDDSVLGKTFERICEICFGKGDYSYSFVCKNDAYYRGYALLSSILCQEIESIEIIGNVHTRSEE